MKIIVYRKRSTNEINNYEVVTRNIKQEDIDAYNSNLTNGKIAEMIDVEEDSLLKFVIEAKQRSLRDYFEDLRDLESAISDLRSSLDCRLDDLERKIEEED